MSTQTAKIFTNGRSQAVRLPKEFHFDTDEAYITRQGENIVISAKKQPGMNSSTLNLLLMTIFYRTEMISIHRKGISIDVHARY